MVKFRCRSAKGGGGGGFRGSKTSQIAAELETQATLDKPFEFFVVRSNATYYCIRVIAQFNYSNFELNLQFDTS